MRTFAQCIRQLLGNISEKADAIAIVDGGHHGKCLQITAKRG